MSNQLLAGAGLPLDEHRALGPADVADELEDPVNISRILGDDVVEEEILLELLPRSMEHLILERPLGQGAIHDDLQLGGVDRLGQEIVRAQPHRLDHSLDRAERRRDDRRDQ